MARIGVADNGDPIPPAERERIFLPYQRAHETVGVTPSIGFGLAVSRQLARLMEGDLTYRRDDDENVFELTLPRATDSKPTPTGGTTVRDNRRAGDP
jgi:two-component system sensor histidine kinase KdpD